MTPDSAESPFDASATQMLPQVATRPGARTHPPRPHRPSGGRHHQPSEPETTPVEVSDPTSMRPVPAEPPTVRTSATRPPTAPFPVQERSGPDGSGSRPDDTPTTPPVGIRVPFWKRLFRRS